MAATSAFRKVGKVGSWRVAGLVDSCGFAVYSMSLTMFSMVSMWVDICWLRW